MAREDRNYTIDLLSPLSWVVCTWILLFGIWSTFALTLCQEFFSLKFSFWFTLLLGLPLATIIAFTTGTLVLLFQKMRGFDRAHRMDIYDYRAAQKMIRRAWIVGIIATVTALFTHYNPTGEGRDFSPTNVFDALVTASLTFGFYKRKLWAAVALLSYFVFWKMILWSANQPHSIAFAGILIALFLWQGIVGIIHERRWQALPHDEKILRSFSATQD